MKCCPRLSEEWSFMKTIVPPRYVCMFTSEKLEIDGSLEKPFWQNAPWTEVFQDIETNAKVVPPIFTTRAKMMWDKEYFYVGIEMEEPNLWGTLTKKNSTMYHENDIEIFIDPDGSHHNYYEFEANCLNTIWELVLNKPYKDGNSIKNPFNLEGIQSAVSLKGVPNVPSLAPTIGWSCEVAIPLKEMVQFDQHRQRSLAAGDIWRVNFSRVQWKIAANEFDQYEKVTNTKENNWVWSPTGVIDMHRPEMWGLVLFTTNLHSRTSISSEFPKNTEFILSVEMVLNTIYYDQRQLFQDTGKYASSFEELYPSNERQISSWNAKIEKKDLTEGYIAWVEFEMEMIQHKWSIQEDALLSHKTINHNE